MAAFYRGFSALRHSGSILYNLRRRPLLLHTCDLATAAMRATRSHGAGCVRSLHTTIPQLQNNGGRPVDEADMLPLPEYRPREGEDTETKRARLLYQSRCPLFLYRKRGMLENGLLLSTFAAEYLYKMTPEQLDTYDLLINRPSNDWELYYWITGKEETPPEYTSVVMEMLKAHAHNPNRERTQPELRERT